MVAGSREGASLWFVTSVPATGTLATTTVGSEFDTVLGVYVQAAATGKPQLPLAVLPLLVANDDCRAAGLALWSCSGAVRVAAGARLYVSVAGHGGQAGAVALQLAFASD